MKPYHVSAQSPKITTVGRAPIIAVALFFLIVALLSALPSRGEIYAILEHSALAGYGSEAETTPERPSVLGEYYDTPTLPFTPEQETTAKEPASVPAGSEQTAF